MTAAALHRTLAVVALAAGLLAAWAGSPAQPSRAIVPTDGLAQATLAALATRIEREEDHIPALDVAEWLRSRRPGLRILDLRPPEEFAAGHLPTAENRTLREVVEMEPASGETFVLVSAGGTHAAQGWVLLAAHGVRDARALAGGYDAWLREVMYPELPRNADAAAKAAFARTSELSRYFGGRPRIVDEAPPVAGATRPPATEIGADELARRAARARRGGC